MQSEAAFRHLRGVANRSHREGASDHARLRAIPRFIHRGCFVDPAELFRIICARGFALITPFVAIRCSIIEVLDAHLGPEVALAVITQLGLSASRRIVNAVIEPIFNRIYDEVLKEKLPYLEMSVVQLRRIVEILTIDDPDHGGNRR
jgi:hypothetical protein